MCDILMKFNVRLLELWLRFESVPNNKAMMESTIPFTFDVGECLCIVVVCVDVEYALANAMNCSLSDFQYKSTRVSAQEIYDISSDVIPEGSTVYIGTDERNKTFFDDMKKHWNLLFLDDFKDLVEGINPSTYGMLDQLVTSRGRYFFGCWFSTLTSYITRLRGYHSEKNKSPGYKEGALPSTYYYAMADRKLAMQEFWPVKQAFHAREFPRSWMDIDVDVETSDG